MTSFSSIREQVTDSIFNHLQKSTAAHARHRVWIMSDLQQSDLNVARECLSAATGDFSSLARECDQIWYLGDPVEGSDMEVIRSMIEMQIELLQPFDIPLIFACGNHDFDPYLRTVNDPPSDQAEEITVLSHELFSKVPGWRSSKTISDFYFTDSLGDYTLIFFPDHAQAQGRWITSGGEVHGQTQEYPHTERAYQELREFIKSTDGPVIAAGHGSFAGGLRPSALMSQILPLPGNVRAHFYGHSHIGEAYYGGPACFRKLSTVDTQDIPQFNVSALENHRADAVRSTVLEIYDDGSLGVFLRDHGRQRWSDAYFVANNGDSAHCVD